VPGSYCRVPHTNNHLFIPVVEPHPSTGAHREGNSQQDLVLHIFILSANYLALSRLSHTSMLYKMPFCGTDRAPKFNGTTDNLAEFIDAYEQLADKAGLQGLDCIKGIIRYLERDD